MTDKDFRRKFIGLILEYMETHKKMQCNLYNETSCGDIAQNIIDKYNKPAIKKGK